MRKWLIGSSVFVHFALILGLFVTGLWRLDRLQVTHNATNLAQPIELREASAAEGSPRKTPEFSHKKMPKDPVQPTAHVEAKPEVASPEIGTTDGSGAGSGSGSGSNTDGPPGECTGDDCGQGSAKVVEEKKKVVVAKIIPPVKLRELRISGETQIQAPDVVKTQIMRNGGGKVTGSFKVCLDAAGLVSSIALTTSTGYVQYDAELSRAMRDWRYRPYTVDGMGVPVCGMVTFNYLMK
jgi:outer membrane biosynthesis protein TonB